MPKAKTFDKRRLNWKELWEGPFFYRARHENGIYSEGHSLSEIESYGRETLDGIARISLSPVDGALVVDWSSASQGMARETFHGGLSPSWLNQLRTTALIEGKGQLSTSDREHLDVLAIASSIRGWLEREFSQAVDAGHCRIWARVGSKGAAFTQIPPDVFRAYRVSSWGYGVAGGSIAEGKLLPTLFSLCVAPMVGKSNSPAHHHTVSGKRGRKPNTAWPEAMEIVAIRAADAKFSQPLARGEKTKLEGWLCEEVERISGYLPSANAARRYVHQVIAWLPNKSSD